MKRESTDPPEESELRTPSISLYYSTCLHFLPFSILHARRLAVPERVELYTKVYRPSGSAEVPSFEVDFYRVWPLGSCGHGEPSSKRDNGARFMDKIKLNRMREADGRCGCGTS